MWPAVSLTGSGDENTAVVKVSLPGMPCVAKLVPAPTDERQVFAGGHIPGRWFTVTHAATLQA